jgi:hypothetical protein
VVLRLPALLRRLTRSLFRERTILGNQRFSTVKYFVEDEAWLVRVPEATLRGTLKENPQW